MKVPLKTRHMQQDLRYALEMLPIYSFKGKQASATMSIKHGHNVI